ncbi:hypothetical protein FNV65_45420 [Streptomyces sp. S1A1-8]|uniref:glycosyltransferase family 39 protein n=1 Tax=Streptomyces TaxID=1883 RepID=UPI000BD57ACB|nr:MULTISPECIES: glycosyltransferase family 39 protein [unclassified Streptomyces]QDO02470.1 hypothetical protein FNV58_46835 [Streptomyces sp. RLB1-9]QDO24205.1 hypothetical protein FNV65_45420 [Streptomyces sp. S1A1-8]QDO34327.1 hypothetical protein FNV63_45440 [Streptomyces sp. S1A1-3]SOE32434.1 Dolichyl-phosphate-mannose-protein mannosyltransferase [Streptomyces sp. OK228]
MEDGPQTVSGRPTRQFVPASPAASPGVWRWRGELKRALPALWLFAGARLAGVLMVTAWSLHLGRHPRNVLGLEWDGGWYWHIARYGYGTVVAAKSGHGVVYNDLAFFPLFPGLIHGLNTVLPIGPVNAALVISWIAAAVAAWGVYAVGELLHGRRVGLALAALWALLPHAVVLTMAYTESLMTAFAAWALYAALTHRWLTAGTLAALAGLCRPNGFTVAAAVITAAAAHLWQRRREGRPTVPRAWVAMLLAPVGWLGYVAWVGLRTHDLTGYFRVQSLWGSRFDFGHYTAHMFKHLIVGHDTLVVYLSAGIVLGCVLLFVLGVLDRQPLPLLVYSGLLLVIALGDAHFFTSRPRLLLPAFPLLLPFALSLARAQRRTVVVLLIGLAGFSLFYGTYLLTVSHQAL